jgi:uncharacterized membrane protein HdeD (DUF308 family)
MSDVIENGYAEWLARIGRAWGWVLAIGVVSVLLGLAAIVYPGATLLVIAVLFGVQLIALAVYRFVGALASSGQSGWQNVTSALLAAIAFTLGVYLLRHPFLSILILAVLLGVFWIAHGVFDLFLSVADSRMPGRGWTVASSVLSIVAGVVVLFAPAISLFTLTVVLGAWLVVYGLILVVRAFRLRSQTEYARGHVGGSVSPT